MKKPLSDLEAQEFALMLLTGAPLQTACEYIVRYAFEITEKEDLEAFIQDGMAEWPEQPEVVQALRKLEGGDWHKLTSQERWELALEKHYNECATFLRQTNYVELVGQDRLKADTCRQVLESKLAGTAGKTDPLVAFYRDFALQREEKEATIN